MEDKERQSAFLSALGTEYFVLQASTSANVSESAARASIYIMALSSFLVAVGFASRSDESFVPLVATVLPGLFVLGLFTVIRLVDLNGHYLQHLAGMARIRAYYRELTPEAADYFSPEETRLPRDVIPSLQLGMSIAFLTTSSTMLASINNIVAGAGIALLARRLLGPDRTLLAVLVGVTGAGALTAAFLTFQKWRFSMFQPPPGSATRIDRPRK